MTRVLVTGAGGYVGGRLVQTLQRQGHDVRAAVREPAPRLAVEQSACDLADPDSGALDAACRDAEAVVHLAGENEVMAARRPAAALAATVAGAQQLAAAAARAGVRRFVYLSTVHVYGARIAGGALLDEQMRPEPRSSYAISRLASEHVAAALAKEGVDVVVLRLTNSVGAPDSPEVDRWTLVANDLCRQAAVLGRLELRSSGLQWRDFVSLGDVCEVVAEVAAPEGRAVPAGVYNLGSGRPTTVRALAEEVQDAFERLTGDRPSLLAPDPEPGPRPEPYRVAVDALAANGLRAQTSLADAVEETARFCLEHKEELS